MPPGAEPVLAAEKILALAGALNAHDRLTRGHGERVRAYTDLIADELDLSPSDRDRLRWSALLHDIGKLAVHPHVLNKPDKLSDEEWEVIKRHPLEGAKLTAPLAAWLGEWASTIAEHHEKFDGSGYPYGLAGHDISLGGRIVAVADCYDTMTAIRTHKRPMSPAAARAELAACAGKHFDPKVVRAFLDVSIGRLRPVAGPLSWLGSLPFVRNVPRLGQAVSALGWRRPRWPGWWRWGRCRAASLGPFLISSPWLSDWVTNRDARPAEAMRAAGRRATPLAKEQRGLPRGRGIREGRAHLVLAATTRGAGGTLPEGRTRAAPARAPRRA